jgi:hypothetical protein
MVKLVMLAWQGGRNMPRPKNGEEVVVNEDSRSSEETAAGKSSTDVSGNPQTFFLMDDVCRSSRSGSAIWAQHGKKDKRR